MSRSLKTILNEANANKLPSAAQQANLGSMLGLVARTIRAAVSSHKIVLPDDAKAVAVVAAFSTAGVLTGALSPTFGAVTTGLVGVNNTGDILFATADAVTSADVVYLAMEGQVFEDYVPVVANSAAPLADRNISRLLEAESLTGTLTGALTVIARGGTVATGQAAASLTGAAVSFFAANAVTTARIKYIAMPGVGTARAPLGESLDEDDKGY